MKIYLASKSPRRQELLNQMGVDFQVIDIEINELTRSNESPIAYSKRITEEKLQAAIQYLQSHQLPELPILCADTEVVMNHKIYGKPKDYQDAYQMLKSYSANRHQVITSIGIQFKDFKKIETDITDVYFEELPDDIIETYLQLKQYQDKAGAYGIQGYMGQYIHLIHGSYYSVMGLPIHLVRKLLHELKS